MNYDEDSAALYLRACDWVSFNGSWIKPTLTKEPQPTMEAAKLQLVADRLRLAFVERAK